MLCKLVTNYASHYNRQHRATGGMIDADQIAIDTTLELIGVLADVVQ